MLTQLSGWAGRKFIGTIIVWLSADIFLWFGKIDSGSWVSITTMVFVAFVGGNVVSKFSQKNGNEARPVQ